MRTDFQLLNAAKAGNQDALAQIFDLYAAALYRYALRSGCDPEMADDIVGDAFAKFIAEISSGKGPIVNLRSYLYRIAYHLIIDHKSSSRRSTPSGAAHSIEDYLHSSPPSLKEREMLEFALRAIQNDLTEDQQQVIVLRFLEDFSLKEIAEILGKEFGNIKVIQNRALAKLRKDLGYS